jgi:hypothetical protein
MAKQKIVIATNNLSKFEVIRPILMYSGLINYHFVRPENLGIELDVVETGSLRNRARIKAVEVYELLKSQGKLSDVYMTVGSDDGIRINIENKTYSDSKMATDRILKKDFVNIGDEITIVRAFAFVLQSGTIFSCITRIPMTFIGNPNNITRQEGVYPLEHVLAYKGTFTPIAKLDQETTDKYNQTYMLPKIKKVLSNLA